MREAMWHEAEASGLALPDEESLNSTRGGADHGWLAALLFQHQARVAFEEISTENESDVLETFSAVSEWPEPIWQRICERAERLPEESDPVLACEELLPVAAQLERESRDLHRLPFIGVAAEQEASERGKTEGVAAGEMLVWLLLSAWALNASLHPSQVITCFSERGALMHSLAGEHEELDHYLLRAFLNNVPLLQASDHLAQRLPRRAREWLFCDHSRLSKLEATLEDPRHFLGTPVWPREAWSCQLGEWLVEFSPPLRYTQMEEIAVGLVETEAGAFMIEMHLDAEAPRLQRLPLHIGNGQLLERLELLQERLERAVWAAASARHGLRAP